MAKNSNGGSPRGKLLRIGVVQDNKVIKDDLNWDRTGITVGRSTKNTFVVPAVNIPKRFPLFIVKKGRYFLQFTDNMTGKVSFDGTLQTLQQLKKSGTAVRRGAAWVLLISETNRGKITIDNVSFLFQFVDRPLIPRPANVSFKPRLIEEGDPVFYGFLSLSAALAVCLCIYSYTAPLSQVNIYSAPEYLAKILNIKPPLQVEETPEVDQRIDDSENESTTKKEEPQDSAESSQADKPTQTQLEKEEQQVEEMLVAMLQNLGPSPTQESIDYVDHEAIIRKMELDQQLALEQDMGHLGFRFRDGPQREHESIDIGPIKRGEVGETMLSDGPDVEVAAIVSFEEPALEGEPGDTESVSSVLKRHKGRIKLCYDQALRRNHLTEGRVSVYISVSNTDTRGKPIEVDLEQNTTNDAVLADCIRSKISRLVFDANTEAEVVYPFVFSVQS